jgi:hypothetical protein
MLVASAGCAGEREVKHRNSKAKMNEDIWRTGDGQKRSDGAENGRQKPGRESCTVFPFLNELEVGLFELRTVSGRVAQRDNSREGFFNHG